MKRLILLSLLALPAFAEATSYVATTGNVALVAAATAATLQQPAIDLPSAPVTFPVSTDGATSPVGATVYCSAACVATIARNCTTPATATGPVTPTRVIPNSPAAFVTLYTASNASGCTTLRVINIAAGQEYAIDLSKFSLNTGGAPSNLHISIGAVTATVNITFYPMEQH